MANVDTSLTLGEYTCFLFADCRNNVTSNIGGGRTFEEDVTIRPCSRVVLTLDKPWLQDDKT